jgi:hypothetical protein
MRGMWPALALACSDAPAPHSGTADGWTVLVWMDGDNNLETYVPGDLDELERAVSRCWSRPTASTATPERTGLDRHPALRDCRLELCRFVIG